MLACVDNADVEKCRGLVEKPPVAVEAWWRPVLQNLLKHVESEADDLR